MPHTLSGQLFGPGLPGSGRRAEAEISVEGLRITDPFGHALVAWAQLTLHRSGFDDAQLRLEWRGEGGLYSLVLTDRAAIQAVGAHSPAGSAPQRQRSDARTRRVFRAVFFATVLLPLLAVVLLVTQFDRVTFWLANRITVQQEQELGRMVFAQMRPTLQMAGGAAKSMIDAMGAQLTAPSGYRYDFYVVTDTTVNAFALPGGIIVVHTGLIQLADTPEQIAGVLAHEIEHVEQRHSLHGMAQQLGVTAIISLVAGDMAGLAAMAGNLAQLSFSREHESAADDRGFDRLLRARIDPRGMRDFFKKMGEHYGEMGAAVPALLSTHPTSDERYAALDARVAAMPATTTTEPLNYDLAAVKAGLK